MRIISKRALHRFWLRQPASQQPLRAWYDFVRRQQWRGPAELKASFRNADYVGNDRFVFNIGGNRFRLIGEINFKSSCVFVRFVGTHADYDRIDAKVVKEY